MAKKRVSIWSIYEEEYNGTFFPYTIKKLVYKPWNKDICKEIITEIEFGDGTVQPTMRKIRAACDKLILASGDEHHIFIENFRDRGNGVWELECGS